MKPKPPGLVVCVTLLSVLLAPLLGPGAAAISPVAAADPTASPFQYPTAGTEITGDITADTTWTLAGSPYYFGNDVCTGKIISVQNYATLTVEPGVVVKGKCGSTLRIALGHLVAKGTADYPITFTSWTDTGPGQWNGLVFEGFEAGGDLEHVKVQYGGGTGSGAGYQANIAAVGVLTDTLRISNSLIAYANNPDYQTYQVVIAASHVAITNTIIASEGMGGAGGDYSAIYIRYPDSRVTLTDNIFTGPNPKVRLGDQAMMGADATLTPQTSLTAYVLQGDGSNPFTVPAGITLTVEPGVTLKPWGGIPEIRVRGHLNALGTEAQPVVFTSIPDSGPGQWYGLTFDGSQGGGGGDLSYTTVRYGGANGSSFGNNTNIRVHGVVSDTLTLNHCTVRDEHNPDYWNNGMLIADSHVNIADTLFTNLGNAPNRYPLFITGATSRVALTNNTFNANFTEKVALADQAMMGADVTLATQNGLQAYVLGTSGSAPFVVPAGITLTLQSGVTVQGGQSGMGVEVQGGLAAQGTTSLPVVFTSFPDSGWEQWRGINVRPGATVKLDHCEFRFAGLNGYPALRLDASNAQMSNCRIHDNSYRGIIVDVAGAGATLDGLTIDHNGRGGISNYSGNVTLRSSGVFTNANGLGAIGGGILNDAGGVLTVVNSSFLDNNGTNGGGAIANVNGTVTILNSTFAGGSTWPAGDGAAILNQSGSVTVTNTIMANADYGHKCAGVITDGGGNLRWPTTDTSCTGAYGDPMLDALQDNGGPTWTMALVPGSAALGLGVVAACPGTDQRGAARPQPAGTRCDAGAYESDRWAPNQTEVYLPMIKR